MADDTQTVSISHFKATCLAVLESVRQTGLPVRVTRRGEPVAEIVPVPPDSTDATWIGSLSGSIRLAVADSDPDDAVRARICDSREFRTAQGKTPVKVGSWRRSA